jgi:hypothetical protein
LLDKIEKEYKKSLNNKSIDEDLLVEIKDYLGSLRSSLDYLRGKVSRYNFPICKTEQEFDNATTDLSEEVKGAMKKWQPFNDKQWITSFNTLNNKSKHITLIPQKRKEIIETRVVHPEGGSVSWGKGVTFGSGVRVMGVPIDPKTQMPVANGTIKTEKYTWVSFEFDNTNIPELPNNISALPFLKECFSKITEAIKDIENKVQKS